MSAPNFAIVLYLIFLVLFYAREDAFNKEVSTSERSLSMFLLVIVLWVSFVGLEVRETIQKKTFTCNCQTQGAEDGE